MLHNEEHIIYNGELRFMQPSSETYVYQDIHTLSHKPRYTAQHLRIINHAADKLFGVHCNETINNIERHIEQLLAHNHTTRNTSVCVRFKLYASGDYSLQQQEVSIYSGYVMRSLRHEATFIASHAPLSKYPTSAMVATRDLMQQIAQARELHSLIMSSPDGQIIIDATQPLMFIKNSILHTPTLTMPSVEQQLIERSAMRLGLQIKHTDINIEHIKSADEVFSVNWQGITSMAHINQRPYMAVLAEKLASEMENEHK
ncbi:MAG: aminotransferase class IV [Alistipes sp.]|nr:aminotransferase class IV [Alistipes sp.]